MNPSSSVTENGCRSVKKSLSNSSVIFFFSVAGIFLFKKWVMSGVVEEKVIRVGAAGVAAAAVDAGVVVSLVSLMVVASGHTG